MRKPKSSSTLVCRPLTPALWPDLKTVFGPAGGCWGCWCQAWMLPRKDFDAALKSKTAEAHFRNEIDSGPTPGLLAYRGEDPVGWVRVSPRRAAPQWNGPRRTSAPLDPSEIEDDGIWAITCFVVPRAERGQGVATALLQGAIAFAEENGARAIDACPVEADGEKNPASIFHGVASMFARAGFVEIARRRDLRPLMRLSVVAPDHFQRLPRRRK